MRMEGDKEFRIYCEDSGWPRGRNGGRGVFVTSGFCRVLSEAHDRVVEKVRKDPDYLNRLREMLKINGYYQLFGNLHEYAGSRTNQFDGEVAKKTTEPAELSYKVSHLRYHGITKLPIVSMQLLPPSLRLILTVIALTLSPITLRSADPCDGLRKQLAMASRAEDDLYKRKERIPKLSTTRKQNSNKGGITFKGCYESVREEQRRSISPQPRSLRAAAHDSHRVPLGATQEAKTK